jgi:hypothetical protein
MSEYDFYQIDATGVSEVELTASGVARTDTSTSIRRTFDSKIANFGALNVGDRMGADYTRTVLDFESKDNLLDHNVITEDTGMGQNIGGRAINVDHNPYIVGSTINRVRDDQFFRLGLSATTVSGSGTTGATMELPGFDVMDTNVTISGMVAGKNWPTEGWRSLGGKYDFTPYVGGGSVH